MFTNLNLSNISCGTKGKYVTYPMSLDNIQYLDGVFLFEIDHQIESHAFVIWLSENTVTIYNTYGSFVGVFIVTYDRNQWINLFVNFSNLSTFQQAKNYHRLFGFTKEVTKDTEKAILQYRPIRINSFTSCRLL